MARPKIKKFFLTNLHFFWNFLNIFQFFINFNAYFWKSTPNFRTLPDSKISFYHPPNIWRTPLNRKSLHALLMLKIHLQPKFSLNSEGNFVCKSYNISSTLESKFSLNYFSENWVFGVFLVNVQWYFVLNVFQSKYIIYWNFFDFLQQNKNIEKLCPIFKEFSKGIRRKSLFISEFAEKLDRILKFLAKNWNFLESSGPYTPEAFWDMVKVACQGMMRKMKMASWNFSKTSVKCAHEIPSQYNFSIILSIFTDWEKPFSKILKND